MGNQRIPIVRVWSALLAAMLATLLAAGAAAAVTAAEPAPRYDPDSTAGKEYALPLAQAREQAGATPAGAGAAGSDVAAATATGDDDHDDLFGAGISPAPARDRAARPGATRRHPRRTEPALATDTSDVPPPAHRAGGEARVEAPSSGISGTLVGVISSAAVVLLAGAMTVLLRPRMSSTAQ